MSFAEHLLHVIAHPHVVVDLDVMAGSPMVRGTRVPVRRLWYWHRQGVTIDTLVKRYPALSWPQVLDALSFAHDNRALIEADLDRERELVDTSHAKDPAGDRLVGGRW